MTLHVVVLSSQTVPFIVNSNQTLPSIVPSSQTLLFIVLGNRRLPFIVLSSLTLPFIVLRSQNKNNGRGFPTRGGNQNKETWAWIPPPRGVFWDSVLGACVLFVWCACVCVFSRGALVGISLASHRHHMQQMPRGTSHSVLFGWHVRNRKMRGTCNALHSAWRGGHWHRQSLRAMRTCQVVLLRHARPASHICACSYMHRQCRLRHSPASLPP